VVYAHSRHKLGRHLHATRINIQANIMERWKIVAQPKERRGKCAAPHHDNIFAITKIYQFFQIPDPIVDLPTEPGEVFARWRSSGARNSKHVLVRRSLFDSQIAFLASRAEVPIDRAFARSKLCKGVDC